MLVDHNGVTNSLPKSFQVLKPVALPARWAITDMGICDSPSVAGSENGICVEDGNNNSVQEVFLTNRNAKFFQYTWGGVSWSHVSLPANPTVKMNNDILVADLDRNGQMEAYVAAQDNHVYRYSGINWMKIDLGSGGNKMIALCAGDGDNDGPVELYAACADGHAYPV